MRRSAPWSTNLKRCTPQRVSDLSGLKPVGRVCEVQTQIENEELNSLLTTIRNQAGEIEMLEKELKSARAEKQSMHVTKAKAPAKTAKATKPAAKSTTKKSEATEE